MTSMGLPGRTATPEGPLKHHPWPFLGSPMAVPCVVFGNLNDLLLTYFWSTIASEAKHVDHLSNDLQRDLNMTSDQLETPDL